MVKVRSRWAVAVLVLVAAAGCGDSNVAAVSGVVTLDSKPLAGASVNFQPIAEGTQTNVGQGSYATTDAEGRYTLKMVGTNASGAVVGKHKVRISQFVESGSDSGGTEKIAERYNAKSTLTFEVPRGGTDKADFPLSSPKGKKP